MSDAGVNHPTTEELRALSLGQLAETELIRVCAHLDECPECCRRIEHLATADPLLARLQHTAAHREKALVTSGQRRSGLRALRNRQDENAAARAQATEPMPVILPVPKQVEEYDILTEVGRGGMGVVYKARHRLLHRLVALKMVLAGDFASPSQLLRIRLEAELAARVQHPNIVQVHEIGSYAGRPFLALEWVDGGSLADRLDGTPWTPTEAARLIEILARAIQVAHEQGVVHRDLKPANVLLASSEQLSAVSNSPDGAASRLTWRADGYLRKSVPKITDFGLAQPIEGSKILTQSGFLVGTPAYMAPERASGKRALVGPAMDIYALGVMLYQLSTGQLPFQGDSTLEVLRAVTEDEAVRPRRLQPHLPRDLEAITLRCLEKEPGRRYPSALALAEDLGCFQQGKPICARPVGRLQRVRKWARRRPAVAALTLAVLALVLCVLIGAPLAAWREGRLRGDAEQLSLRLTLEKAWSLPEQGQVAEGMLWLVRCLEVAPADDADLQQAIRANLAAWHGYVHPLRAQLPHGAGIAALAFSPDGKRIATGGLDKTVRLWDTRTGQPISPPLVHEEAVQAVAFTGDGKRLVVATVTPRVYTWDATARKLVREPLKNAAWPAGMRRGILSPDGLHMLVIGTKGTSRVWETESGTAVGAPLQLDYEPDQAIGFSPDGSQVIFPNKATRSQVQVQEISTGRAVGKALLHPGEVAATALTRDAAWAVLGGEDQTARIWDLVQGQPVSPPLPHQEAVRAVAFSPDGRSLATSGDDKTVRLWEAPTGRAMGPPLRATAPVDRVVFSPDGSCIAAADQDGIARLWQVGRRQPDGKPLPHPLTLLAVAFSPDGRRAATACWDGTFREWDLASHQPVGKPLHQCQFLGMVVAYSPDGTRILTAGWREPTAQQWDAVSRQPVGKPLRHQGPIIDAAYCPNGSQIVTGSADKTAQLWDAQTGAPLGPPLQHNALVHAVAFHPDGTRILTGSHDKTARTWDTRSFQPTGPPLLHAALVTEAVFSPSGALILTATVDGLAQLWDAATRQPMGEPMRPPATIRRAAFSPDGRRIVTASHDGTARLWDVTTRRSLGPPLEHPGAVKAVAFSPDGRRILTGDATGRAWLWDAVQPVAEGEREHFQLWVEVSTGQALDVDTGRIRVLDFATWDARRRRLAELGGPILPSDR